MLSGAAEPSALLRTPEVEQLVRYLGTNLPSILRTMDNAEYTSVETD